jgi:hypothetical protein
VQEVGYQQLQNEPGLLLYGPGAPSVRPDQTTTTSTTTTTTYVIAVRDTACGILTLYAGDCGAGVLGPNTCGRLQCAAGEDHFAIQYRGAPPPVPGDILGDCTGVASTYQPELEPWCAFFYPSGNCPRTSRLVCPTCCPQGIDGQP